MTRAAAAGRRFGRTALALAAGSVVAPLFMNAASAHVTGETISSPTEGQTISGAVTITGTIDSDTTVTSWSVQVAPDAASPSWVTLPGAACSNSATTAHVNVSCAWDTTKVVGSTAIAPNGAYVVQFIASDKGSFFNAADTNKASAARHTTVSNRAAAPTNVHASFNEGQQVATVTWAKNAEPDITGYTIKESVNGGAYKIVGSAGTCSTCSWDRVPPQPGTYKYVVLANRSGASASNASAESESFTLTAPPTTTTSTTTTTTTAPGGGTSGGSTGGSTSGGSTGGSSSNGSKASGNDLYSGVVVNGFHLVAIPGGSASSLPGQSVTVGGRVTLNEPQEGDPGFNPTLPYKKADKPADSTVVAIAKLPGRIITDESARKAALTVPAIGLLLFVFAMQVRFVTRRAAA